MILNKSHFDFSHKHVPECTKGNSALAVSNSLVTFPLYGQSASSNGQLSLTQLANGVHPAVLGSHPSRAPSTLEGAEELALFLRPQACSISVCLLFNFVMYWKVGMAKTKAVHVYMCACEGQRPCSCERTVFVVCKCVNALQWTSAVLISDRPASLSLPNPQKHLFRPRYMTEVFKTESCHRCVLFPLKNVSNIVFSRLTETETEGGLGNHFYVRVVGL